MYVFRNIPGQRVISPVAHIVSSWCKAREILVWPHFRVDNTPCCERNRTHTCLCGTCGAGWPLGGRHKEEAFHAKSYNVADPFPAILTGMFVIVRWQWSIVKIGVIANSVTQLVFRSFCHCGERGSFYTAPYGQCSYCILLASSLHHVNSWGSAQPMHQTDVYTYLTASISL